MLRPLVIRSIEDHDVRENEHVLNTPIRLKATAQRVW